MAQTDVRFPPPPLKFREYVLEFLERLLGHKSMPRRKRYELLSLIDLRLIRSFDEWVREIDHQQLMSDAVNLQNRINRLFFSLLESCVEDNTFGSHENFNDDGILQYSAEVADLLQKIKVVEVENAGPYVHPKLIKVHMAVQFILDHLELLLGQKAMPRISWMKSYEILSLQKDLRLIRSFNERVQEILYHQPIGADLVTRIVLLVDQLFGSFLESNTTIRTHQNFNVYGILQHSAEVADILQKIKVVEEENAGLDIHPKLVKAHTAVQFILEDLELLLAQDSIALNSESNQVVLSLYEDLKMIRSFSEKLQENSNHQSTLSDLVNDIFLVVHELLDAIDSNIQSNIIRTDETFDFHCGFEHSAKIVDLVGKIKVVEEVTVDVQVDGRSSGGENFFRESSSSQDTKSTLEEQIVVGFEDEARELLERLNGDQKQLEVIPIIGMGGIGKTTLANRLYNDFSIIRHFHIRARTSVSQLYQKRNLLKNILSSILSNSDPIFSMSEEDMEQKLYRCFVEN